MLYHSDRKLFPILSSVLVFLCIWCSNHRHKRRYIIHSQWWTNCLCNTDMGTHFLVGIDFFYVFDATVQDLTKSEKSGQGWTVEKRVWNQQFRPRAFGPHLWSLARRPLVLPGFPRHDRKLQDGTLEMGYLNEIVRCRLQLCDNLTQPLAHNRKHLQFAQTLRILYVRQICATLPSRTPPFLRGK